MDSEVKKLGWAKEERHGGAGQTLPTSSHRWRGGAGSNLCFRESNMVVKGEREGYVGGKGFGLCKNVILS